MKLEELMIGDWIMWKSDSSENEFPVRVTLEMMQNELYKWNDRFGFIPITSEILEKNGFVKRSDRDDKLGKMEYYQFEDYGFVYHYSDGEWEFSLQNTQDHRLFSGYLNYVHEFQHALRLCKIDKEITL